MDLRRQRKKQFSNFLLASSISHCSSTAAIRAEKKSLKMQVFHIKALFTLHNYILPLAYHEFRFISLDLLLIIVLTCFIVF